MRIALFATCLGEVAFPQAPQATVELLERLGCTVDFPRAQTCCGQMLTNSGYGGRAVPMVRDLVAAFEGYDYVVAPSGSCVGSVRHQHADLARTAGQPALAQAAADLAARMLELTEFLVDVLGVLDVGAQFPHRVAYHQTCHSARVAKIGDRPIRLLQQVRDLELAPIAQADACCGFGGTFSVKNPDVSMAMGTDKVQAVLDSGAEVLVAADASCLLHLGGILQRQGQPLRVMHLAEVLNTTGAPTRHSQMGVA